MIINEDKLNGCDSKILYLKDYLLTMANDMNTDLIITSGYRSKEYNKSIGGSDKSWHCKGLAIDFYFKNVNVFKKVTDIYYLCEKQEGDFKGVTEFEVCRGKGKQHFHLAFGNEPKLETFTGVYK